MEGGVRERSGGEMEGGMESRREGERERKGGEMEGGRRSEIERVKEGQRDMENRREL